MVIHALEGHSKRIDGIGKWNDEVDTSTPLYLRISQLLAFAIEKGNLSEGQILLEGPIADLLHVTRTPVRQALQTLQSQGLLSRFNGRGLIVGKPGTPPKRMALHAAMLGLTSDETSVRKPRGWETIYHEVERDVVHLSVFDRCRLNEQELARHYGVGRLVARDVLQRLESLGLVIKDDRQRWTVIPLDRERIGHLFELRMLLEPSALQAAVSRIPKDLVLDMMGRLEQAIANYPDVTQHALDRLEIDLHIDLLSYCPNSPLLDSLQRTRSIITLSKHVLGATAPMPKTDPFMAEHLAVIRAVYQGNARGARKALIAHLKRSCIKVTQRAEFVQAHMHRPNVVYAVV